MFRSMNQFNTTNVYSDDLLTIKDKIILTIFNKNITDLKKLIKKENVNIVLNKSGYTSLHFAVLQDDKNIIKYLLDCGADPTIKHNQNQNCIDFALDQNKIYLYEYLNNNKNIEIEKIITKKNNEINILNDKNEKLNFDVVVLRDENKFLKKTRDDVDDKIFTLSKELDDTKKESLKRKRTCDESEKAFENLNAKYIQLKKTKDDLEKKIKLQK